MGVTSDTQRSRRGRRKRLFGWRPAVAAAGVIALIGAQQLMTVGGSSLLAETVTNALHIPLFAAIAGLLAMLGLGGWRLVGAVVALAAGTEGLQVLTARNASLLDLGLDLLGALPVIGALALNRRFRHGPRQQWAVLWTAAVLVVLMTVAPVARVLLAYHERDRLFPALLVPGAWQLAPLLSTGSRMRLVEGAVTGHGAMLELVWADERYPGLTLHEVVPDWQGFETLAVDVHLAEGPPLPLTAAVGHRGTEGTAAFQRRSVEPGARRVEYDLRRLLATPDGVPPRITKLILHTKQGHAGRRLLIGTVRLVGDDGQHAPNAGNLVP